MTDIETLLGEMTRYCHAAGIEVSVLGRRSVQDSKFFARLEGGGECLPSTMAKVRRYMAANPPTMQAAGPAPEAA